MGEHRSELEEAVRIIDWWRGEHVRPLSTVATNLYRYAAKEGDPIIAQRLKRGPTIAGKLLREQGMKLSRMEDIGGVRAVFPSQEDGYRALHLVNRNRGRLIEVQLRTTRQDKWANAVEGATRRFPELKSGGGPTPLRDFFRAASAFYAMLDGSIELEESQIKEVEDLVDQADTFTTELFNES